MSFHIIKHRRGKGAPKFGMNASDWGSIIRNIKDVNHLKVTEVVSQDDKAIAGKLSIDGFQYAGYDLAKNEEDHR